MQPEKAESLRSCFQIHGKRVQRLVLAQLFPAHEDRSPSTLKTHWWPQLRSDSPHFLTPLPRRIDVACWELICNLWPCLLEESRIGASARCHRHRRHRCELAKDLYHRCVRAAASLGCLVAATGTQHPRWPRTHDKSPRCRHRQTFKLE